VPGRTGRFLDLSLQSIILLQAWLLGQAVNLAGKLAGQLPGRHILKSLDFHLASTVEPLNREPHPLRFSVK
jgi:hypothetical protein